MARNRTVGYTPSALTQRFPWIGFSVAMALVVGVGVGMFFTGRATAPVNAETTRAAASMSVQGGVPVPDRHTAAGAATAAENFLIAEFRVSSGTLDAAAAVSVLLSPQASDSARQALAAPTGSTNELAKVRTAFAALSAVVRTYNDDRATVDVWGVAATSAQVNPTPTGTEDWGSSTVTLDWDGAQWRVRDQRFSAGPWPARADQRLATADGDFGFRFSELPQHGWAYVAEQ
jgi:hypothetical protein